MAFFVIQLASADQPSFFFERSTQSPMTIPEAAAAEPMTEAVTIMFVALFLSSMIAAVTVYPQPQDLLLTVPYSTYSPNLCSASSFLAPQAHSYQW